jgi:hypothetical protein
MCVVIEVLDLVAVFVVWGRKEKREVEGGEKKSIKGI